MRDTWIERDHEQGSVFGDHRWRKGRGRARFSYGYRDLARLLDMEEAAIRQAVHRGRLNPSSLQSVVAFYLKRQPKK